MSQSERIDEITKALVAFQAQAKDIQKDSKGYGYEYASLGALLQEVRPILSQNGLFITSAGVDHESMEPVIVVKTTLMHISGQWISSVFRFRVNEKSRNLVQESGSVISYIRRYAIAAILNLTQVDNDGEIIVETKIVKEMRAIEKKPEVKAIGDKVSFPTFEILQNLIRDTGTRDGFDIWMEKHNVTSLSEASEKQALKWIEALKERKNVTEA